jgi:hypothetical protein
VNYRRSFFYEGQGVAEVSAVEVTGLGFVDQFAQQAASANAEGAHDCCHAPLVAAPLTPGLFRAAKHLSVSANAPSRIREALSLPAPQCASASLRNNSTMPALANQ